MEILLYMILTYPPYTLAELLSPKAINVYMYSVDYYFAIL